MIDKRIVVTKGADEDGIEDFVNIYKFYAENSTVYLIKSEWREAD